jgi:photosystem II stability/assembly factor-like uncharacterized protein
MTIPHRLYVGTIGEGLWRSLDGGDSFLRTIDGMFVECHVRALVSDPRRPMTLFLGNESGVYRSDDGADSWARLNLPVGDTQVWSILLTAEAVLVGACPARLFRSADGGRTWTEPTANMQQGCPRIIHTRITSLCAHPGDPKTLWAGVEIDGVHRSRDGGATWQAVGSGLSSRDIHALVYAAGSRRLLASTNNDLNVSLDDGDTWTPLKLRDHLPLPYFRGMTQPAGQADAVLLGNGDAPPGTTGLVARSLDGGATWRPAEMPGRSNSTMWNFATHAADPALIYASSVHGQVYRSTDAGASWRPLARQFGEIRALAWTP